IRSLPAPAFTSSSPLPGKISSLPLPPSISSSPPPPLRRSLPPSPSISSSPARPTRRSSLSVPRSISSPAVPVRTFARASWVAKSAPTITTIMVSKMYSRFIRLPALVYLKLVLLVFSNTHQQTLVQGLYPSTIGGRIPLSQAQR